MKSRLMAIALAICSAPAILLGQDVAGTWQGTLTTPAAQVRIVLRIARAADGKLEGQLFAIDQGAQPRTMSQLSVDGRVVKWRVDALSASYEGTFTPDNSIKDYSRGGATSAADGPGSGSRNRSRHGQDQSS